jgi:GntR family transcriptional regulator
MLPFRFTYHDGMPVSDQLALAVRRAILAGEIRDGEPFPSVRTLVQELKISHATVHKVVAELRDEGFLAVRPGIGMVVTVPAGSARDARVAVLRASCDALLREASLLQAPLEEVLAAVQLAAKSHRLPDK